MTANVSISVIIPTYNEENFILSCLNSLLEQTVDKNLYEILVVDGNSIDNTCGLVQSWKKKYSEVNIKLIDNPKKITPCAFNIGIQTSQGQYVTLFGAHSTVEPDFLSQVLETFESHPEIDACGGIVWTTFSEDSQSSNQIAYIMQHPFGVGTGMRTPGHISEGYSSTVAKVTYRKKVLKDLGGFDENLIRTQDKDMNHRLIKNGGKIWLNPKITTTYFARASAKKLFKTAFFNSYFLGRFLRKHRQIPGIKYMIPTVFVSTVLLLFILCIFNSLALVACFFILMLHQSVALGVSVTYTKKSNKSFGLMPLLFLGLHISYGIGLILGFVNNFHFLLKPTEINTR